MKYFELVISILGLVLSVFWFKSEGGYEPAIVFLASLVGILDALRRHKMFGKVKFASNTPKVSPWSYRGGKVDISNISVELVIDNGTANDIYIKNIKLLLSEAFANCLGESKTPARILEVNNGSSNVTLPFGIESNISKILYVEETYNATALNKYVQAEKIGNLRGSERFSLTIEYIDKNNINKITKLNVPIETDGLKEIIRSKYEEAKDFEGALKLIDKA